MTPDDPVAEELSGKDYFDCERLRCRLRLEVCAKRQAGYKSSVHHECACCPQGKANLKKLGLPIPKHQRTTLYKLIWDHH